MQVYRGQGLVHFYTLCRQVLSVVEEAKYLGILISDDLNWSPHISSITGKAASTPSFLRRNLRKCPVQLKERAYITFVRSTLDYASPIWDPFLKRDMNNLEKINRKAARFVTVDYHPISSISSMLHSLGWFDLKDRRRDTQLALLFKIVNGDVVVSADDLHLEPADRRTRSNHRNQYKHKGASTPELQNFFSLSHYEWVELASFLYSRGRVRYCLQRPSSRTQAARALANSPPPPPPTHTHTNGIYTPQRRPADYLTYTYT